MVHFVQLDNYLAFWDWLFVFFLCKCHDPLQNGCVMIRQNLAYCSKREAKAIQRNRTQNLFFVSAVIFARELKTTNFAFIALFALSHSALVIVVGTARPTNFPSLFCHAQQYHVVKLLSLIISPRPYI